MFSKELECLDCGYRGRSPRESSLCPHCWSDNVLTMTNRQRRRRSQERRMAVFEALAEEEALIQDTLSQLHQLPRA